LLERLAAYMRGFYPNTQFPLEFWHIEDDELFLEALGYLPLMMDEEMRDWDKLPEGFKIAFPIFWLEDDYQFNGWTALNNAGEWLLPLAVAAYQRAGMESESKALAAALAALRNGASDDDELEAAYKSVPNEYRDDAAKYRALLKFFRENSRLFEEAI
jgi:hypothetical protein